MTYPLPSRGQVPSTLMLGAARRRLDYGPPPLVPKPRSNMKAGLITAGLVAAICVGVAFIAGTLSRDQSVERRGQPVENRDLTARGKQAWEYSRNVPASAEESLAKLKEEIRISREKYPQIVDLERGLRADVVENNGWTDLELAARITGETRGLTPAWLAALSGLAARRAADDSATFDAALLEQSLADTGPLTVHLAEANSRGVVVPMSHMDDRGALVTVTPHLHEYLDLMLGRVVVHFERDRVDAGRDELLALVTLCSRCNDDRTRAGAEWWSAYRNRVLKVGVLAAITRGQLTVADVKSILELRWRTEGNDKQMWLNNLAATVARYQWSLDHDNAGLLPKGNTAKSFTNQGKHDLHAYAFHVKTAREHVDEAEHNELDLRDDSYVAKYLDDYTGNELLDLAEG